jgi:protein phosphatase 2C family protein 2/3
MKDIIVPFDLNNGSNNNQIVNPMMSPNNFTFQRVPSSQAKITSNKINIKPPLLMSPLARSKDIEPLSTRYVSNNTTIPIKKLETINVMSLLNSQHIPLTLNTLKSNFNNYESTKHSSKPVSFIKAYSANTHQGTIRNYNEDRVSIILNVVKPSTFTGSYWPKCSIFGIFDGHGGNTCADYLRDNLHQFVIKDPDFPNNPRDAIIKGFENAEKEFLNNFAVGKGGEVIDRSGSCAVVLFIIGNLYHIN